FRSNTALLSYAYNVQFQGDKFLRFGINTGIFENHMDLSDAKSEGPDIATISNQNISRITFLSDFGISFLAKGLYTGVAIPRLIETKLNDDAGTTVYTLKRHYMFHVGYSYYMHRDWEIKPLVLIQKTIASPLHYEGGVFFRYRDMIWMNMLYRASSSFTVGLGGIIYNKLAISYAYEFSGNGMLGQSSGTHEVSLGVLIGNEKNALTSIFGAGSSHRRKPYFGWSE
ncbi:MAG: PorP/SprF family type IX secretion system membrane protein, partial [Flavobacteriales bacterium]